jgi:NADPH:quinone reductase-like Zn-dependent oxidoreductase
LVEVSMSGVNFLDAYQRSGSTPLGAGFTAGWRVGLSTDSDPPRENVSRFGKGRDVEVQKVHT